MNKNGLVVFGFVSPSEALELSYSVQNRREAWLRQTSVLKNTLYPRF